ncbi:Bud-site selection protein [Aspergillus sclerotioniger CBS 115572]|uniref:Bud-site selection protein n=1 Tax=Aspergillus sclerotioniger CBS 115572 TaxID=1450535 RepID=A0A317WER8_9EURO|nr:Bud-site selection protein [Aspergillus sclerotioniger CBS 115572]PWY83712.1 Bud-site selection protein [Aspergillus sclerotioniger CBS 115572]
MPKRNFSDYTETRGEPTPEERAFYLQKTRLFQQFEYGVVTLSKALKVARGFERQKLSRREKTAKTTEGKEGTLSRLAEEVEFTKTLDPIKVAENYLFRQLVKTKRIAESPVFIKFKESKRISAEGPKSPAEANVTARLYKSTPVKNVFPGIMDGIRKLLGVENKAVSADGKGAEKKQKKGVEKDGKMKEKGAVGADKKETKKKDSTTVSEVEQSGDEEDVDMDDADDADSIDFAQFDARLASGSEDEDGEERADDRDISDSDDDDEERIHSHQSDISISRSPSPEQSDSPPSKKAKGSKKASSAPATSTTFLPSLSMGGYWSGSESEAEDIAANEPPKRKNRMGQQARRALWEKKYGSGANHVKRDMGKRGRDNGWDARRGATGGGDRWGRGGNQGWGRPQQQNGRPQRAPPAKPQDNKPLHPSWEAAKKAKEQKNTASFQGKKVVFD